MTSFVIVFNPRRAATTPQTHTHQIIVCVCFSEVVKPILFVFPDVQQVDRKSGAERLPVSHLDLRPAVCSFLPTFQRRNRCRPLTCVKRRSAATTVCGCRGDHYDARKQMLATSAQKANTASKPRAPSFKSKQLEISCETICSIG